MIKSYKRGKSLLVVKRYLKIKYKINVSLNTLLKRFENCEVISNEKTHQNIF